MLNVPSVTIVESTVRVDSRYRHPYPLPTFPGGVMRTILHGFLPPSLVSQQRGDHVRAMPFFSLIDK